jgi:hypothetical protein
VRDLDAFSIPVIKGYCAATNVEFRNPEEIRTRTELLAGIQSYLETRNDPPGVEVIPASKEDPPWEPEETETPEPPSEVVAEPNGSGKTEEAPDETTAPEEGMVPAWAPEDEPTKPGEPGPDLLTKEDIETLPWASLRKAANERGVRGKNKAQLLENLRAAGHPV